MSNVVKRLSWMAALSIVAGGCFAEAVPTPAESRPENDAPNGAPEVMTDEVGNTWVRGRAVEANPAPYVPPPPREGGSKSLDTLSDEQLAEALRPLRLYMGYEYKLSEAPIEMVRRGRAEGASLSSPPYVPEDLGTADESSYVPGSDEREGRLVFGTDNRAMVDQTLYPFTTMAAQICNNLDGDDTCDDNTHACTVTRVGPNTLLTAAHCVHNGTSSFFSQNTLVFGADNRLSRGATTPFNVVRGDPDLTDTDFTSCYVTTITSGWVDPGLFDYVDHLDVAVIQLLSNDGNGNPCPDIGDTGWLGVRPDTDPNGRLHFLYGYPTVVDEDGDAPPHSTQRCWTDCTLAEYWGCQQVCVPQETWSYPTIWGIGNSTVSDNNIFLSDEVSHEIDVSDGQSGSAIYAMFGTEIWSQHADPSFSLLGQGRYVVAIHKGSFWVPFEYLNKGPLITGAWLSFFREHGGLQTTNDDPCDLVCEYNVCYCNNLIGLGL